jgi:glycosyltransferase involved in cell wall biosynthesis
MTADLLERLVVAGHEVSVYAYDVHKAYERNGVTIQNDGYLSRPNAMKADVFITHPEIRIGAWQYVYDVPYIGIVHNTSPGTLRSLERKAPDLTIVNSHYTKHFVPLVAHNTGLGVHIIHPPVLIEPKAGNPRWTTTINISLEKGGSVMNYLARQNPTDEFLGVLGGHGLQIEHHPSNVRINKPTSDMQSIYADTRLVLFPTHAETYGKVVAEAMQFGIPVLASDLAAVREVGGDSAIYLDPYEYDSWNLEYRRMNSPTYYDEWAGKSKERGVFLKERSEVDLQQWEHLVSEVPQFDERRKR